MRSNIANILRRLTVPFDAKETDPRIVIATDDPLSADFNRAAISFYWDQSRGFVAGVDRAGDGPSALGQWRLYGLVTGFGLSQFVNATYDPTDGGRDNVSIRGGSRDSRASRVSVTGPVVDLGATTVGDDAGRDVRVFGVSLPRGPVVRFASSVGLVAAVGTAETPVATVPPATYRAGRAYEVRFRCQIDTPADCDALVQLRKGDATLTGPVRVAYGRSRVIGATGRPFDWSGVFIVGSADVTTDLTLSGTAFGVGAAVNFRGLSTGPLVLSVTDVGASSDHGGSPILS